LHSTRRAARLAHLKSVAREASADAVNRITAYLTTAIERQFNRRVEQADEHKAAADKAMIEVSKTSSQCLRTTASQLALVSDEMAAAIFKAANVISADQREAIAGVATKQGLGVAEAIDYAEKRGEEVPSQR
jgi:hypothetical protein